MNIQRLKFASARGARIEVKTPISIEYWTPVWFVRELDAAQVRIHPDDAHLEYGPLSSALRAYAMQGDHPWSQKVSAAILVAQEYFDLPVLYVSPHCNDDFWMTLLFVAEYLADMGL